MGILIAFREVFVESLDEIVNFVPVASRQQAPDFVTDRIFTPIILVRSLTKHPAKNLPKQRPRETQLIFHRKEHERSKVCGSILANGDLFGLVRVSLTL